MHQLIHASQSAAVLIARSSQTTHAFYVSADGTVIIRLVLILGTPAVHKWAKGHDLDFRPTSNMTAELRSLKRAFRREPDVYMERMFANQPAQLCAAQYSEVSVYCGGLLPRPVTCPLRQRRASGQLGSSTRWKYTRARARTAAKTDDQ